MSNNITPPSELLDKWDNLPLSTQEIFVIAAQWGADQELEACCKWLAARDLRSQSVAPCLLRIARRPKPPSLKEQALAAVAELEGFIGVDTIRRALEALPE